MVVLCFTGAISFPLSMVVIALGLCFGSGLRALALSAAVKHLQRLYGDTQHVTLADLQLELVEHDYEALLALDEAIPVVPASDAQLQSLVVHRVDDHSTAQCCVCLEGYAPGAQVMTLPACRHVFHAKCATSWVQCKGVHVRCPLCNAPVFAG